MCSRRYEHGRIARLHALCTRRCCDHCSRWVQGGQTGSVSYRQPSSRKRFFVLKTQHCLSQLSLSLLPSLPEPPCHCACTTLTCVRTLARTCWTKSADRVHTRVRAARTRTQCNGAEPFSCNGPKGVSHYLKHYLRKSLSHSSVAGP